MISLILILSSSRNQNDINTNDNDNNIMATREDDPLIIAVYAKSADVDVITERNPSVKKSSRKQRATDY